MIAKKSQKEQMNMDCQNVNEYLLGKKKMKISTRKLIASWVSLIFLVEVITEEEVVEAHRLEVFQISSIPPSLELT